MPHKIITKTKQFTQSHKILSSIIILVVLFVGYKVIKAYTSTTAETRYIIGTIERGTIISTVTGTGQIAASNQVDIKSKVSGNITSINVTNGQEVKAGTLIASIDARDAEVALENARISYQKLTKAADTSTLLQAQNSLESARQSHTNAIEDLQNTYNDAFVTMSSIFLDLPDVEKGLGDLYAGNQGAGILSSDYVRGYGSYATSLRNKAETSFFNAQAKYTVALSEYKNITQKSNSQDIEAGVNSSYEAVKSLTQALKDAKTAVDFIKDQARNSSAVATSESNLSTWTSTVSSELQNLSSITTGISSAKNSIITTERDIAERTASLEKIQEGADPLDIRSEQLSLQQKEYAYQDYFLRAPFDGIVAKVNVKSTDTISSGTSVATFIAKQQIAKISLNEVEVSKVKRGQKVTLTFDAVDSLTITGKVSDIDFVGTVTQGVVVYNVEILLDTQDERIKPGMSVSAAIATEVRQDVLTVPNSAIKTQGNNHYVEVVDGATPPTRGSAGTVLTNPPVQTPVEIGIADDLSTEVVSGLHEGEKIVTRTIQGSASPTSSSAPSIFGAAGVRGGGGAAVQRIR